MEFKTYIHKFFTGVCFLLLLPTLTLAQAGPDKVRMLVNTLEHDSDYKVRIAAAQALGQIADGTVADWMVRAFRHENNDAVRLSILYSISEISDHRILSPLIELANQEDLSTKERMLIEQIIWNYREVFNTSAWIAEALNSNDTAMKRISIWVLGLVGETNMIPIFQKLLASQNEDIQSQTLESLSKMGDAKALEYCKNKETESSVSQVQRAAKLCEQMNSLLIQNKIPREKTFRRKLKLLLDNVAKNTFRPANYFAYLNKNLNRRQVDEALAFLVPQAKTSNTEKSVKLIEKEKIRTFQLVVDLVSKYEFDSRDLEILKSIIREGSDNLDHCYTSQLKNNPELKGDIKTYFKILKSGTVAQVKITESTMKNKTVESCMLSELQQFEFPSIPIDYVNLIYTFTFNPPPPPQIIFAR